MLETSTPSFAAFASVDTPAAARELVWEVVDRARVVSSSPPMVLDGVSERKEPLDEQVAERAR